MCAQRRKTEVIVVIALLLTSEPDRLASSSAARHQPADMPEPDRDRMDFRYGLSPGLVLITPSPPHSRDTRGCHHIHHREKHQREKRMPDMVVGRTPLVGALALHGVSGPETGSHLGSTLKPGRAVLTRGVFRRSGSVACIRADASPTEVLAASHVGTGIAARQTRSSGERLMSAVWQTLSKTPGSPRRSRGCTPPPRTRCRYCKKGVPISTGR
jgi:hypothetical protein